MTLKGFDFSEVRDQAVDYIMANLPAEGSLKIRIETTQQGVEFRLRKAIEAAVAQKLRENTPENPAER